MMGVISQSSYADALRSNGQGSCSSSSRSHQVFVPRDSARDHDEGVFPFHRTPFILARLSVAVAAASLGCCLTGCGSGVGPLACAPLLAELPSLTLQGSADGLDVCKGSEFFARAIDAGCFDILQPFFPPDQSIEEIRKDVDKTLIEAGCVGGQQESGGAGANGGSQNDDEQLIPNENGIVFSPVE